MLRVGKFNRLPIVKKLSFGFYLDGGDEGEILLPIRYVPKGYDVNDLIDVFVYFDSDDRLIATTEQPFVQVGQFAVLKALSVTSIGAFLDWGLAKDLLVPFREQKQRMVVGRSYAVFCYIDRLTGRIVASAKIEHFLSYDYPRFLPGQEVDLLIVGETELGFSAIVEGEHLGMLYRDEVFRRLRPGDQVLGFVKQVRPDKKIDLMLQRPGYAQVDDLAQRVLRVLRANGGFLTVTDSSEPEMIYGLFQMSKKNFKKAIGALYRQRLIEIEDRGIRLIH